MKDLTLSLSTLKKEAVIFLCCILIGELINLYAVIHFCRPAIELLSQIGYAVVIGVIFYALIWVIRIIVLLIRLIIKK